MIANEHIADLIKTGENGKPRDIDPSSKPPMPSLVRHVAEMLTADPTSMPPFELGIPSTRRRLAALRRLKRVLGIRSLQAEMLLTASALTHDRGKENYAHALALGKYIKHGAQAHDGAEEHRIYLRAQLSKLGYSDAQVNLALAELEPSLGILNVTTMGVQGWLVRQALAYNQEQERAQASNGEDVRRSPCCDHEANKQSAFHKVDTLLRANGMHDAAAAIHQAASAGSTPSKKPDVPAVSSESGQKEMSDAVNNVGKDAAAEDHYWDKPPAVKQFLMARNSLRLQMQQVSNISPRQLLRTFDMQLATGPTFLEAIQHLPEACGVKYELAEFFQRYIEGAKVTIHELELGSRMFLADILERSSDIIMRQMNEHGRRELVEAEFVRAFKRCGDSNEAMQYVVKVLRAPAIPTPSWRQTVGEDSDTPRSLGAAYRLGHQETWGMSAQRKASGRATARLAAQQERGVEADTPAKSSRYHNADAVSTLRKMLKEDPELGNLPAEQQLRLAARRVNRRIDFDDKPAKESPSNKRSASQREDDSADDEVDAPPAEGKVTLKAKRSEGQAKPSGGGDDHDSTSSSGSSTASDGEGSGGASGGQGGSAYSSENESKEDSDDAGSSCGSNDDDSRESNEGYDTSDGFCVSDSGDGDDEKKPKGAKKKRGKPTQKDDAASSASASKRASSVNSLGTPKKSEGTSSAILGGNVFFGEDELKKWTTGSEKYKQGFNWPAYIHHKQNYDNYCQFKGVHAARTFKSVIHARLVPALCGFCGLKRQLWKDYEDSTVILAIEKTLRPSRSTDFALELKQIKIADDKELSLMQNYTAFSENFTYKVAEAEDANRSIKPNVIKTTFKAAVSGHEILKLWLEEVPWRGLNKANARLLRKLREVRSWEQLQRKGITSAAKKQLTEEEESDETKPRREGFKKTFRGTRAGKSFALKKRIVRVGRKGHNNYGASNSSENKRTFSKFNSKESNRGSEGKRKHPGLDQRGESWHDNKELFECFNTPCSAPFCQRCGRHGHIASDCRIPDEAPGINQRGYYQEEKKGKARIAGPPPRNNAGRADADSDDAETDNNSGKNNAQRGSSRRCLH